VERPQHEPFVVARNGVDEVQAIRPLRGLANFVSDEWPDLPTAEKIAFAKVHERINVVLRHDIALPRARPDGEQDESDVVTEKTILDVSGNRDKRGIVPLGDFRALLEIEWKQRKAMDVGVALGAAARERKQLKDLKPVFVAETVECDNGIEKIPFIEVGDIIFGMRNHRRNGPGGKRFPLLMIKQGSVGSPAGGRGQSKGEICVEILLRE